MSIELDIATVLQTAGVGTLGTDLFTGPMRDRRELGDRITTVLLTGGFDPQPYLGGSDAGDLRQSQVQVMHRSDIDQSGVYTASALVAENIFNALHKRSTSDYVAWLAGEPIYIEKDDHDRHHWSINVTVVTDTSP